MVIDTSAVVAILFYEAEAADFATALADTPHPLMSAVTRVELSFVIEGRKRMAGRADIENFLDRSRIEIVPVSLRHAEIAIAAFRRFGRGQHQAALNIGDCFSYALAKAADLPLLFKGNDFTHTDIRPALIA